MTRISDEDLARAQAALGDRRVGVTVGETGVLNSKATTMALLELGHGTTIDIDPDDPTYILLVHGDVCVPIWVRHPPHPRRDPSMARLPPKFKKARFAGDERP
jgi:hypothetical protein